ncbi:hypothetical protein ACI2KH_18175 [Roseomonas mucosa]|uniref:hypothetical protein n=1 Tax=Roseomonas mucosa TaxID=207340 RepID=UPI00384EDDAE
MDWDAATVTIRLVRSVSVLLVGTVGFAASLRRLGSPAQAVEQSGWLYRQFGSQGIVYGMHALTGLMALVGAVLTWNVWKEWRG